MWFAQDAVTTYTYTTTTNDAAGAGLFAGVMLIWLLLMVALFVVQVIAF